MYLRDPLGWTPKCCGLYLEPSRDLFSALQRTNPKVHIGPLVLPMGSFPKRTKNCLGGLLKPNILGASFRSSWASVDPQPGKGYQGSCFQKKKSIFVDNTGISVLEDVLNYYAMIL